jgi:hypothetical protein
MRFVVVEAEAKALGWVERRPHPEGAALYSRNHQQIIVMREHSQSINTFHHCSSSHVLPPYLIH